jgi:glutathione synthase/RimK-type ligase-like ATP-grasp enzyme
MTARVALVTAAAAQGLDEDMPLLLRALAAQGAEAAEVVWDDPAVEWGGFDLVVVRSTWDYFARREEFLAWAERVAAVSELHNPVPVLRWNSDKRYLLDLERAGVPIVPTTFVEPDGEVELPAGAAGTVDLIVKPAVSAGSNDTARYGPGEREAALAHVARLQADGRVAMVQPYQHGVDEHGETALLYFDGRFSHAIRKGAIFASGPQMVGGLFAREEIRPREPSAAEREVGEAALRAAAEALPAEVQPLLYARVDLVPLVGGSPGVLELELCEPSVFLAHAAGGVNRLTAAITGRREAGLLSNDSGPSSMRSAWAEG